MTFIKHLQQPRYYWDSYGIPATSQVFLVNSAQYILQRLLFITSGGGCRFGLYPDCEDDRSGFFCKAGYVVVFII